MRLRGSGGAAAPLWGRRGKGRGSVGEGGRGKGGRGGWIGGWGRSAVLEAVAGEKRRRACCGIRERVEGEVDKVGRESRFEVGMEMEME